MKIYDINGIQKIHEISDKPEECNNGCSPGCFPRFLEIQGDDGLGYLVGVSIVNGEPVLTLELGSPFRMKDGVPQLQCPDDGLWYSLLVTIVNGQAVLGLSDSGML